MTAPAGRFYWLSAIAKSVGGAAQFGPFFPTPGVLAVNLAGSALRNNWVRNKYMLDTQCRAFKFPGVLRSESPAHCRIAFPAAAAITDHSTLEFIDANPANVGKWVFEFKKVGPITPGNIEVDISAAVTGADVAVAFLLALATYNLTVPMAAPSGFLGVRIGTSATVDFIQAFYRKNSMVDATARALKGTWVGKTWGSLGNLAPVLSIAAEWTGLISGFSGGKRRLAGIPGFLEMGVPRAQFINTFFPELVPPREG